MAFRLHRCTNSIRFLTRRTIVVVLMWLCALMLVSTICSEVWCFGIDNQWRCSYLSAEFTKGTLRVTRHIPVGQWQPQMHNVYITKAANTPSKRWIRPISQDNANARHWWPSLYFPHDGVRHWELHMPIWLFCGMLCIYLLTILVITCFTDNTTECPQCGYDLAGLPYDCVCPECGGKWLGPQERTNSSRALELHAAGGLPQGASMAGSE